MFYAGRYRVGILSFHLALVSLSVVGISLQKVLTEERSLFVVFLIGHVIACQLCDWPFTRQSFARDEKKRRVTFAIWQKLSRDYLGEPWVDSFAYLPSPSSRLLSCQLAEWLHWRLLFAVLGVTSFVSPCVWKKNDSDPRDILCLFGRTRDRPSFSQAKLAAARRNGCGWIFIWRPSESEYKYPLRSMLWSNDKHRKQI